MCQRVLRAHVPTCLACLRAVVSTCHARSRDHMPACLESLASHGLRYLVTTCQHALSPRYVVSMPFTAIVVEVVHTVGKVENLIIVFTQ